jgi:hypothetical protein
MTVSGVRSVIAAAVKAVTGLECHATVPDVIQPPLAILRPVSGDWDMNLPRSSTRNRYELTIVLPAGLSLEEAQDTLDAYLESAQLRDAIEKANYAGQANYARVIGWRDYAQTVLDQYIGVRFDIVVY